MIEVELSSGRLRDDDSGRIGRKRVVIVFRLIVFEWVMVGEVAERFLFHRHLEDPFGNLVDSRLTLIRAFSTYMKSAAPHALKNGELVGVTIPAGCAVPNIQHDAMFFRGSAIGMKDLAAGRIGPGENNGHLGHVSEPSSADLVETSPRRQTARAVNDETLGRPLRSVGIWVIF
jgi:hypothetical protein